MKQINRIQSISNIILYNLKLDKTLFSWNGFRFHQPFSMAKSIKTALCIFALIGLTSFQISDDVFKLTIAKASKLNTRNSESDIIRLSNGDLLLGWTEFYAGSGADDGSARIVGRISKDGGRSWGDKYTLVEHKDALNVMEVSFLRLKDGSIALFYLKKIREAIFILPSYKVDLTKPGDCRLMMRVSNDEGKSFVKEKQITGPDRYLESANGRSLRLKSGRILIEIDNLESSACIYSDDDGKNWREGQFVKPAAGPSFEPIAVELKDGRVMMFMRTSLGGQYQTFSNDGGETWTEPSLSMFKGSGSPMAIERIPSTGDLLAIWNNDSGSPRTRTPLTATISKDDGKTWEKYRNIENNTTDGFAYPAITWVSDYALITYFNYTGGMSLNLTGIPLKWFYE
ncbi:MAG: sialidase family protein [Chitinophagaceae bacterium]